MSKSSAVAIGSILEKRYRILRELGHGSFGRTYLAEDINRYNEQCVLKEFAPQVLSVSDLRKAQELFEREAGMLYKLQHPQIPRFRELIWVNLGIKDSLFLVQDYIAGQTYWDLLKSGKRFTEAEVIKLLLQILPVLEYIHSQNILHRDISPDNLIERSADKLPFLIDFGCVKQMAANALSQSTGLPGTIVGKNGYAPEEQMAQGRVSPGSDLYALGVTALVLLTGAEPQELYNSFDGKWCWRDKVSVGSDLGALLDKMLAYRSRDRYSCAAEIIPILRNAQPSQQNTPLSPVATNVVAPSQKLRNHLTSLINSRVGTVVVAPGKRLKNNVTAFLNQKRQSNQGELQIFLRSGSIAIVTIIGIFSIAKLALNLPQIPKIQLPNIPLPSEGNKAVLTTDQSRLEKILQRRQLLRIDPVVFNQKVDQLFYAQHPELRGRSLTNKPEDAELREEWCKIAEDVLDKLERGKF